jgi:hypothetical protein
MCAVTGFHRLPILAIAALLAAGCGATPQPSPTISPPPHPSPERSATPEQTATPGPSLPIPTPVPRPAAGCSALDDVDLGRIEVDLSSLYPSGNGGFGGFSVGHVNAQLQVTRITELSGQQRSAVPQPRHLSNGAGQMLGGREFVTFPSTFFEGSIGPQSMVDARVTLSLAGTSPIDLPTRFVRGNRNFNQVAVTVPDVAGPGDVTVAFVCDDACFRYEASATIPLDVVPLERYAGCELDEDLYWDQLRALLDGSIMVDGTAPSVGSPFNESRFAPYVNPGIDAFMAYMFDADAPELIVASGGTLRIDNQKPRRLDLAGKLNVVVWTRRSIVKAITDYPPKGIVEISQVRLERQPDSSYQLPVPAEPGRYVVGLSVKFESRCTTGTLWSVVNVATV